MTTQDGADSQPGPDEGDEYAIREPVEQTAERSIRPMSRVYMPDDPEEDPLPEPPALPLFSGVFTFPCYPWTLPPLGLLSVGVIITALGVILCLAMPMPTVVVRCFGVPVCLFGTFVLSYMSACFVAIIEQTAEGRDKIVEWPSGYWRDWFWSLPSTVGMLAPPLALVGLLGAATGFHPWWLYLLAVVLLYPLLMLSALDNGSAANPYSPRVLRSMKTVWWAWAMVYGASILMGAGWYAAVKPPFGYQPAATVLGAAPAAVALIFIYARLLGRLCWCFDHYEDKV